MGWNKIEKRCITKGKDNLLSQRKGSKTDAMDNLGDKSCWKLNVL